MHRYCIHHSILYCASNAHIRLARAIPSTRHYRTIKDMCTWMIIIPARQICTAICIQSVIILVNLRAPALYLVCAATNSIVIASMNKNMTTLNPRPEAERASDGPQIAKKMPETLKHENSL